MGEDISKRAVKRILPFQRGTVSETEAAKREETIRSWLEWFLDPETGVFPLAPLARDFRAFGHTPRIKLHWQKRRDLAVHCRFSEQRGATLSCSPDYAPGPTTRKRDAAWLS